ncbi:MAG: hypothetical protein HYR85_06010 [Planctomycetes bacterium]|nr:hypothetical protein [Planctomycetota bacterium]MBI3846287.1 hypothetical protein [Planctomycetota bacterium]
MTKSSSIKAWVVAMLVTAFVAGGTTFSFLRNVFPVPPPRTPAIERFRKDWIETFSLAPAQVQEMDRMLKKYEGDWDRVANEMYQKYRPIFAALQNQTQKDIESILTAEQKEVRQREVERRRRDPDEKVPTNR